MPATIFGMAAVEVVNPDGEVVPYKIDPAAPIGDESRAWALTKADGDAHRVSLHSRDGPGRVRCDARGFWGCSCEDFRYRHRKVRLRSAASGCKHTDAVRDMLGEGEAVRALGPTRD